MFSQGEPPRSEARNRINGKTPKRGVARMERAKPVIGQGSLIADFLAPIEILGDHR
jgi:hypothetical protein